MDELDRDRVQVVKLAATVSLSSDEMGFFQQTKVLHDSEPGHIGQHLAQLAHAESIGLSQSVEQRPPTGIGQRPKHKIHRPNNM